MSTPEPKQKFVAIEYFAVDCLAATMFRVRARVRVKLSNTKIESAQSLAGMCFAQ